MVYVGRNILELTVNVLFHTFQTVFLDKYSIPGNTRTRRLKSVSAYYLIFVS